MAAAEWPHDAAALCKRLWREGMPASAVSEQLAVRLCFTASRSAIIGKMNRDGIQTPTKSKSGRGAPPPRAKPMNPVTFKRPPAAASNAPVSPRIPFAELTAYNCRYAYGDAAPFMFCGAATEFERSYCPYHCGVVYYRPGVRR